MLMSMVMLVRWRMLMQISSWMDLLLLVLYRQIEAGELLLRICDGDRLIMTTSREGTGYMSQYRRWEWGVTVSHLFPSFPTAPSTQPITQDIS